MPFAAFSNLTKRTLIEKHLVPKLHAKITKLATRNGEFIDYVELEDHNTQLKALDMMLRMHGTSCSAPSPEPMVVSNHSLLGSRSRHCYAIKAIGLEPQIEPWLPPDNRTACCVISRTTSSRQRDESEETKKSRILTSIHGLDVRGNFLVPSDRGRTFFLDIPLYRTRLPDTCPVIRQTKTYAIFRIGLQLKVSASQSQDGFPRACRPEPSHVPTLSRCGRNPGKPTRRHRRAKLGVVPRHASRPIENRDLRAESANLCERCRTRNPQAFRR